jgi:hypothetical protein
MKIENCGVCLDYSCTLYGCRKYREAKEQLLYPHATQGATFEIADFVERVANAVVRKPDEREAKTKKKGASKR